MRSSAEFSFSSGRVVSSDWIRPSCVAAEDRAPGTHVQAAQWRSISLGALASKHGAEWDHQSLAARCAKRISYNLRVFLQQAGLRLSDQQSIALNSIDEMIISLVQSALDLHHLVRHRYLYTDLDVILPSHTDQMFRDQHGAISFDSELMTDLPGGSSAQVMGAFTFGLVKYEYKMGARDIGAVRSVLLKSEVWTECAEVETGSSTPKGG